MLQIMAKSKRKILSFSTTMRNPERIASFLNCIKDYSGQILDETTILKIVKAVISNKLYRSTIVNDNPELIEAYSIEEKAIEPYQVEYIIQNSSQKHKEKGFDEGWESRFDTWYKLCKEFGFVYYEKNKPIKMSESGYMLCDAYNNSTNEESGKKIQNIFLNSLIKYQTNNPFRKNLNDNAPIILLLNLLKKIKDNGFNSGISRKEIPFILCWHNNDSDKLFNYIKKFREEYGYNSSDEIIYEKCLELLESDNQKRFKFKQITKESVDDFIRKIRITGLFSLRGMGRYVDINSLEKEKIEYILKNYTNYKKFDNELEYFEYVGSIDPNIILLENENLSNIEKIRKEALIRFAKEFDKNLIYDELAKLENNSPSKHEYFKIIDAPTRLEFLTSISLIQNFENITIKSNYSIDDDGNPTFTAKGGVSDIEVLDINSNVLFEVTLMKNKSQAINEIPAITRHLMESKEKSNKVNNFSVFIAPNIHQDTLYMCDFTKHRYGLDIIPKKITEFTSDIQKYDKVSEFLLNYSN